MQFCIIQPDKMDIVFLGVNDAGMQIYEWLCDRNEVDVRALLTEPDQLDIVRQVDPDFIVSVGFDHLVPPEVLNIPSEDAINLHPSYLPYNRGKSPNVWPLIEGTPAGVTLHSMGTEFDTGDIIAQKQVETDFSDTGKVLHQRLEDAQFELFTETWPNIKSGDIKYSSQDDADGSYHTKTDFVELCELDPSEEINVKTLLDRLRALTFPPFDNAYLDINGERYYVDVEIRKKDDKDDEKSDGLISSY
ncbi:methionyl-tRNA formyltransferase [Halobellus ordinarius]|uniref:methionyl-tRNA formyltransferase n=1 Tax=Halobellus ordinarius TaxID=3075120 RepID=UPI00288008E5|nr:formyltransferase family protein [Halobellus sp. ZY16]